MFPAGREGAEQSLPPPDQTHEMDEIDDTDQTEKGDLIEVKFDAEMNQKQRELFEAQKTNRKIEINNVKPKTCKRRVCRRPACSRQVQGGKGADVRRYFKSLPTPSRLQAG